MVVAQPPPIKIIRGATAATRTRTASPSVLTNPLLYRDPVSARHHPIERTDHFLVDLSRAMARARV